MSGQDPGQMFWSLPAGLIRHFQISLNDSQVNYPMWVWVQEDSMNKNSTLQRAFKIGELSFDQEDIKTYESGRQSDKTLVTGLSADSKSIALTSVLALAPFDKLPFFMKTNGIEQYDPERDYFGLEDQFYSLATCKDAAALIPQEPLHSILISHQHMSLLVSASLVLDASFFDHALCGPSVALTNSTKQVRELLKWFTQSVKCTPSETIRDVLHLKLLALNDVGNVLRFQEDQQFATVDVATDLGQFAIRRSSTDYDLSEKKPVLVQLLKHFREKQPPGNPLYNFVVHQTPLDDIEPETEQTVSIQQQPSFHRTQLQPPELCFDFVRTQFGDVAFEAPMTLWQKGRPTVRWYGLFTKMLQDSLKSRYVQRTVTQNGTTFQTAAFGSLFNPKSADKLFRKSQVLGRILTAFFSNQFRAVVVGPSQLANLIGRSLVALVPPSCRQRVIYAREPDEDMQCIDVDTEEAQVFTKFGSQNSLARGFDDPDLIKLGELGAPKQVFAASKVCPRCGRIRHLPVLVKGCSVQCIAGSIKNFHISDFLSLGQAVCVVDCLAQAEEDVVVSYGYQKGFQTSVRQMQWFQITGQQQFLAQVYANAVQFSTLVSTETQNCFLEPERGFEYLTATAQQRFTTAAYLGEAVVGHFLHMLDLRGECYLDKHFQKVGEIEVLNISQALHVIQTRQNATDKYRLKSVPKSLISLDLIRTGLGWHVSLERCAELVGGYYAYNAPALINCPATKQQEQDYLDVLYKYVMEYFITDIFELLEVNSPLSL